MAEESNETTSTVPSKTHSDVSQDKNEVKAGGLAGDEQSSEKVEEEAAAGSDAISEGKKEDVVA